VRIERELMRSFTKSRHLRVADFPEWNLRTLLNSVDFLDTTNVGLILHDDRGFVLECNDTAVRLFGTTREALVGRAFLDADWGIVREDGTPYPTVERPEMISLREDRATTNTILGFDIIAKARRWLSVNTSLAVVDSETVGVISSFIDITAQIQREHTMHLMRAVNRFAMATVDTTELLQKLCDEMVSLNDYSLAWIGEPSESEPGVVHICFSAGTTGYLYEDIVSSLVSKESGLGPTGVALRTGEIQIANDLPSQEQYGLWCTRAAEFGFSSSMAVPFYPGGKLAVLSIYDRHPFVFDESVASGLQEITKEIEKGIQFQDSVRRTQTALDETTTAMVALAGAERAQGKSEERFQLAFEGNMAPMVVSDRDDCALGINDAFCEMVGLSREEILGHDSTSFTYPDDIDLTRNTHERMLTQRTRQVRYVKRYLRKGGNIVVSEVSLSAARDEGGELLYFVSSERDVTDERALATKLSHQALHDPLTGLANRSLLEERLNKARARVLRQGGLLGVLMIDLDDFKGVNDTHGHLVGDELLVGITRRFEKVARPYDTLCRFGGDEFLYLAEDLISEADVERIAMRFLAALIRPFSVGGVKLEQHASIGAVTWDELSSDGSTLVQNADVALYEAKKRHKGSYEIFDSDMRESAVTRFTLNQELRQALQNDEISMQYQPIVNLSTKRIMGFEALMRWQHPERGAISPDVFIPIAEQNDVILDLGMFALREAATAASRWGKSQRSRDDLYVSVNVASQQLQDPRLMSTVEAVLLESGLDPNRLVLEITETAALFDVTETIAVLTQLRELGVGIALDDFGTGFSSLSYLLQLAPRVIKIDRSFVSPVHDTGDNEMLLETIIALGKKLRVTLIPEGIETESQLNKLLRLGCKYGQGFLFSRSVKSGDVNQLIAAS
jgi:diguanylate cyclase (GGDEF)-like protein/PAS domain S-box-containing protein